MRNEMAAFAIVVQLLLVVISFLSMSDGFSDVPTTTGRNHHLGKEADGVLPNEKAPSMDTTGATIAVDTDPDPSGFHGSNIAIEENRRGAASLRHADALIEGEEGSGGCHDVMSPALETFSGMKLDERPNFSRTVGEHAVGFVGADTYGGDQEGVSSNEVLYRMLGQTEPMKLCGYELEKNVDGSVTYCTEDCYAEGARVMQDPVDGSDIPYTHLDMIRLPQGYTEVTECKAAIDTKCKSHSQCQTNFCAQKVDSTANDDVTCKCDHLNDKGCDIQSHYCEKIVDPNHSYKFDNVCTSKKSGGSSCESNKECNSDICEGSKCRECLQDSDCNTNNNECVDKVCRCKEKRVKVTKVRVGGKDESEGPSARVYVNDALYTPKVKEDCATFVDGNYCCKIINTCDIGLWCYYDDDYKEYQVRNSYWLRNLAPGKLKLKVVEMDCLSKNDHYDVSLEESEWFKSGSFHEITPDRNEGFGVTIQVRDEYSCS